MSDACEHDLSERETACADGVCPICLISRVGLLEGRERVAVAERDALAERADAAEAENARLREERGTLICTGSLAKPEYTPLGEMLRQVDNQRIEAERRADALHKALASFLRAVEEIGNAETLDGTTYERAAAYGCLATPSAPKGAA